jgi:hypothetical protein
MYFHHLHRRTSIFGVRRVSRDIKIRYHLDLKTPIIKMGYENIVI